MSIFLIFMRLMEHCRALFMTQQLLSFDRNLISVEKRQIYQENTETMSKSVSLKVT